MRTTFILDDDLYRQVKLAAAQSGVTVTSVVEDALRLLLSRNPDPEAVSTPIPVSRRTGWVRPGVDIDDSRALTALLDDDRDTRAHS